MANKSEISMADVTKTFLEDAMINPNTTEIIPLNSLNTAYNQQISVEKLLVTAVAIEKEASRELVAAEDEKKLADIALVDANEAAAAANEAAINDDVNPDTSNMYVKDLITQLITDGLSEDDANTLVHVIDVNNDGIINSEEQLNPDIEYIQIKASIEVIIEKYFSSLSNGNDSSMPISILVNSMTDSRFTASNIDDIIKFMNTDNNDMITNIEYQQRPADIKDITVYINILKKMLKISLEREEEKAAEEK